MSWAEDCDEGNAGASAPVAWYLDGDGDGYGDEAVAKNACSQPEGYVAVLGDCDDADDQIYPDAAEACDATDNDCDGDVDEDLTYSEWFLDGDGDGYGDEADVVLSCGVESGRVLDSSDCDDTSALSYPGADETCDDADNDCDGRVDENVQDLPVWYEDLDEDGHGNAEVVQEACDAPDGYVTAGDDCDDADATLWLQGEEEIFYNGVDDNCLASDGDGDADGDYYWASDYAELVAATAEELGEALEPMPIPAGYEGDCNDDDGSVYPVALDVPYDGIDSDCNGSNDYDFDADGYDSDDWGGDDCDDNVAEINPGATEIWYDGIDQDCDGSSDYDADADGHDALTSGGDDCDDTSDAVGPGFPEVWYDGIDGDCGGEPVEDDFDRDGDGYPGGSTGDDCDDLNAAIHPGALELCSTDDDDDCSGSTNDEGAEGCDTLYADLDDDGFGDPDSSACICDPSDSFSAEYGTDCDDDNSLIHPEMPEDCETDEDDDCDLEPNEEGALNCETFYLDEDRDGYGTPDSSGCFCDPVGDMDASESTDCDDGVAEANPAAEEVCGNPVDEDCDGEAQTCSEEAATVLLGEAGDEAGSALAAIDDLLIMGAPGHDDGDAVEAGALYLVPLDTRGIVHLADVATTIVGKEESDRLGEALFPLPDVDGNHRVAVSAPTAGSMGSVYVLSAFSESGSIGDAADYVIYGETEGGELGSSITAGSGMLGAGTAQLVIGNAASGSTVWLAPLDGEGEISVSSLDTYIVSPESGSEFGRAVLAIDLTMDGLDDLVVGLPAFGATYFGDSYGATFMYEAPLSGELEGMDYTDYAIGATREDRFGSALANLGDVDGDGVPDMAIGAEQQGNTSEDDDPGAVYIVTAPTGFPVDPYAKLVGVTAKDWAGSEVAVGDWDGDGTSDLLVGAYGSDVFTTDAGIIYVVFGPFDSGTHELEDVDHTILGSSAGGHMGYAIAGAPDQDDDGSDEIFVGMPNATSPTADAGQAFLLLSEPLLSE